jgi:hypothetical protein
MSFGPFYSLAVGRSFISLIVIVDAWLILETPSEDRSCYALSAQHHVLASSGPKDEEGQTTSESSCRWFRRLPTCCEPGDASASSFNAVTFQQQQQQSPAGTTTIITRRDATRTKGCGTGGTGSFGTRAVLVVLVYRCCHVRWSGGLFTHIATIHQTLLPHNTATKGTLSLN